MSSSLFLKALTLGGAAGGGLYLHDKYRQPHVDYIGTQETNPIGWDDEKNNSTASFFKNRIYNLNQISDNNWYPQNSLGDLRSRFKMILEGDQTKETMLSSGLSFRTFFREKFGEETQGDINPYRDELTLCLRTHVPRKEDHPDHPDYQFYYLSIPNYSLGEKKLIVFDVYEGASYESVSKVKHHANKIFHVFEFSNNMSDFQNNLINEGCHLPNFSNFAEE